MGREQHAVHARGLGAAQERADVVGILEGIQHQDERWLVALGSPGEDIVQARELARFDDERDPLMAIEAGEGGERATLDLDDRDPQVRRMQHELLEGRTPLRDDEQTDGGTTSDERFLDRASTRHELLVGAERLWWRQR